MYCVLETIFALFASFGVVFFIWWIVAIFYARFLPDNFSFNNSDATQLRYIKWLKFAGIFPPEVKNEDPNGTRTDNN